MGAIEASEVELVHGPDGRGHHPGGAEDARLHVTDVLPLIGERVVLMHPDMLEGDLSGGDLDIAVDGLDPLWPLRLPSDWRLVQALHYDTKGWYWVLERGGQTISLDTVDDPQGLGRDGLPTREFIELSALHPQAARAAYLTAKRIRKAIHDPAQWKAIAALASTDARAYRHALSWVFGERIDAELARSVGSDSVPSQALLRSAKAVQWFRRRRTPKRLAVSTATAVERWYDRVAHPTGLLVVVLGPDGVGKTTLATALQRVCAGAFRRSVRLHWRPGLLPRAGSLIGAPSGNATQPHARPTHGRIPSHASLIYHWMDFIVGGWLWFPVIKVRSGLILVDRWYWDLLVDPHRFRLSGSGSFARVLGKLIVRPDLAIVLEAHPTELIARKSELEPHELGRQVDAYRRFVPRHRSVTVDAARPIDEVVSASRDAVFSTLARRTASRLGPGWTSLPGRSRVRWTFPRGNRRVALTALSIYQPTSTYARLSWRTARAFATAGLFRITPKGDAPLDPVRAAVAAYMPPGSTLAVMKANHPGRFLVMIIDSNGRSHAIAKVALDQEGARALEVEARNIERFGQMLEPPLYPPRVLERGPGIIVLEPVKWMPRRRPWLLHPEVAFGMGRAFTKSSQGRLTGMAHGDLAPWNLLWTRKGWVLVDWEQAQDDAPLFFDVFHHVVQTHVLLGRPSYSKLVMRRDLDPRLTTVIDAYASGAGRTSFSWREAFAEYLRLSLTEMETADVTGRTARERLLRGLAS